MSLCPPQILSCLGRWRIEKCPFPSWLTPLGVFHWTVTELQWPASHFLGISALAGNSKEVTGYFGLPWGAGAEAGSELPAASPHAPPCPPQPPPRVPHPRPFAGGAAARRSLPRAGRAAPRERHQSLPWNVCGSAALRERYGARDHERDTAIVIAPSNQGEAERQACQQYLLLFLPCAALY